MVTDHTESTTGVGAQATGAGSAVITTSRAASWWRGMRTFAPLLPFFLYVFAGLGIPTLVIINLAFRSNDNHVTLQNVKTVVDGGQYLLGFETSLKLAFVTSVIPAVLGTIIAYFVATSKWTALRRFTATCSAVFANFGGVNLAFIFIATIGTTGLLTTWLNAIGLNPWDHGFSVYKFWGVAIVYMYFQIPLMVLIITPAVEGLKKSWREAAANLGAANWQYWRYVGLPVLMPAILGSTLLLLGSGLSAYATAEALTGGTIELTPIQIGDVLNGNVIANEANIGYALGFCMIVLMLVIMTGYVFLQRRASKWLR